MPTHNRYQFHDPNSEPATGYLKAFNNLINKLLESAVCHPQLDKLNSDPNYKKTIEEALREIAGVKLTPTLSQIKPPTPISKTSLNSTSKTYANSPSIDSDHEILTEILMKNAALISMLNNNQDKALAILEKCNLNEEEISLINDVLQNIIGIYIEFHEQQQTKTKIQASQLNY